VKQLVEVRSRGMPASLFDEEGVAGVYLNHLTPAAAEKIAAAFAVVVASRVCDSPGHGEQARLSFVLASDGRPLTAGLVAAAGEGLRWAGCEVIDIGPATSACLARAIDRLQATGGALVGQAFQPDHPVPRSRTRAGMKFWAPGPKPLSRGGLLDEIEKLYHAGVARPTRTYGPSRRYQADDSYLADLAPHYHALRPLRVVLDCDSVPFVRYLEQLTRTVACRIIPYRGAPDQLSDHLAAERVHFAARVEDDAEVCQLFDEQGRAVPPERLLPLLRSFVMPALAGCSDTERAEARTANTIAREQSASSSRAEAERAMRGRGAAIGGGVSGRLWHMVGGVPVADALRTLTLLLVLLSRSDRPFSAVLDHDAPLG
jgi:hypothetical protein